MQQRRDMAQEIRRHQCPYGAVSRSTAAVAPRMLWQCTHIRKVSIFASPTPTEPRDWLFTIGHMLVRRYAYCPIHHSPDFLCFN